MERKKKEVISLEIGENESSKYWLGVLIHRGVKDIMQMLFSESKR